MSSVVRHHRRRPYLLSFHVSRLVHRSTNFYSTYITFFTVHLHYYINTVHVLFTDYNALNLLFLQYFTDRVFTVHYYVNTVQVLLMITTHSLILFTVRTLVCFSSDK